MKIRWKLFLTLFLLTVGVSATVLALAERELNRWVMREVSQRFAAQVSAVLESRRERLEQTRGLCTRLATDPVVRAAARGSVTDADRSAFLRTLAELRQESEGDGRRVLEAAADAVRAGRPGGGRMRGALPLVGVVRGDGEVLFLGRELPMRRRPDPERVRAYLHSGRQEITYLVPGEGSGINRVQETVVTPVEDGQGRTIGCLFFGLDAETAEERAIQRAQGALGTEGRTGLVIDGEWHVPGAEREQLAEIAAAVAPRWWSDPRPQVVRTTAGRVMVAGLPVEASALAGSVYQIGVYPLDSLLEAIGRIRWTVGLLAVLGTLVAALAAWALARRLSRPITALVAATERVRGGDFGTPVEVLSRDELGHLGQAFNEMTRDLALKDRYHEVLGQVSDPVVARKLLEGDLQLGGELREVTVLFCDIRGFTPLTEGMDPARVIDLLNEHMTALTKVVHNHGGVVDKFVGDLLMALFGAPHSYGDDTLRAVRCALGMIAERQRMNLGGGRVLEVGIGLARGQVVAGCMGSATRLNYTVLGERVNLASRLCSAALAGEVLADEAVAAAVAGQVGVAAREPMRLKGFASPVAVYALLAGGDQEAGSSSTVSSR